ncbi:MAG: Ig-like domain-containing protein, partial [Planctomycetes bacterium]|nr:Ig-like domain-containing protein [Planctomycetota bacterium]
TPTTVSNVTIRRNYFDTEGQGIFWERYEGTITNVLVENNIIVSTLARAWSCQTTGGPVLCRNNTFMFPPEQGLSDPTGGGALCYMDNWSGGTYVFANNTCRYISRPTNASFIGRNYIVHEFTAVDPGSFNASPTTYFQDFTNHDFRLKASGPAVNAGDPTYASTTDILGRTRDAQPDIGAYEYNAADSASLESLFVAMLRAEQTAIRGGSAPPDLAVAGWAVAADHGPAGTLVTAIADGYTEARLAGFSQLKIAFSRAVDPTTVQAGAITIVGDAHGDVSDHIQSLTLESGGTVLTVALSSLPDADTYTVTVTDVLRSAATGASVSGDADVSLRMLGGDVDGSGAVTAADLLAVRTAAGQAVTGTTAASDVDESGVVTMTDVMRARSRLGQSLP